MIACLPIVAEGRVCVIARRAVCAEAISHLLAGDCFALPVMSGIELWSVSLLCRQQAIGRPLAMTQSGFIDTDPWRSPHSGECVRYGLPHCLVPFLPHCLIPSSPFAEKTGRAAFTTAPSRYRSPSLSYVGRSERFGFCCPPPGPEPLRGDDQQNPDGDDKGDRPPDVPGQNAGKYELGVEGELPQGAKK